MNTDWPTPNFDENDQPHFLFILTLPEAGSTAIAKLLNTAARTMILYHNAEGEWLIPGLRKYSHPWDSNKLLNPLSVKATWLKQYQNVKQLTDTDIEVVIEKTPPNMVIIDELVKLFDKTSLFASNRNPYAYASSAMHRYDVFKNMSPEYAAETLSSDWVRKSKILKNLISEKGIPYLKYEDFCESPQDIKNYINLPYQLEETINFESKIKVKDYQPQKIQNMNQKQLDKLTNKQINIMSSVLKESKEILNFFGYEIK